MVVDDDEELTVELDVLVLVEVELVLVEDIWGLNKTSSD
jgi:hypothetical protein